MIVSQFVASSCVSMPANRSLKLSRLKKDMGFGHALFEQNYSSTVIRYAQQKHNILDPPPHKEELKSHQ